MLCGEVAFAVKLLLMLCANNHIQYVDVVVDVAVDVVYIPLQLVAAQSGVAQHATSPSQCITARRIARHRSVTLFVAFHL
jgi:hypothetical protein